jgi:hypothetical protein
MTWQRPHPGSTRGADGDGAPAGSRPLRAQDGCLPFALYGSAPDRPAWESANRVGERPGSRLARLHVRPMHSADGHQYGCERSDSDADQPDPASSEPSRSGIPLEGQGHYGGRRLMPARDIQRGPHRVRITADGGQSAIEFLSYPGRRPVDNSGDLCVGNAFEVTEHQQGALESRELIVCNNDRTELFGHSLHPASDSRIGRVPWLQEGSHRELAQVRW